MRTLAPPVIAVPLPRPPLRRRLYGLGSVYGKTVRDARLGTLIVAALLGLIVVVGGLAMSTEYGTPEARRELAALSTSLPPVMRGIYGNPVNVDTLGGFVTWHYAGYFSLIAGLWAILEIWSDFREAFNPQDVKLIEKVSSALAKKTPAT